MGQMQSFNWRKNRMKIASGVAVLALSATTVASVDAAALKSGIAPGSKPAAFFVLDATGPSEGKTLCYRCRYGARPTVTIFTKEMTPEVTSLVKELDGQVAKNSDKKMAAFGVLLTNDPKATDAQLKKVAKDAGIKNIPLTTYDDTAGPADYELSSDAAVTVLMWVESNVKVNHAFSSAKLGSADLKKITADTAKILN